MIAVPDERPVTIPPATAALVLSLLQAPPGVVSVRVIDEATQTRDGPVIVPANGCGLMVMYFNADVDPQPLVMV